MWEAIYSPIFILGHPKVRALRSAQGMLVARKRITLNWIVKLRSKGVLAIMGLGSAALSLWLWVEFSGKDQRFDALILAASQRYDVDPALIKAVVWRESRFDASAHGRAGELGLMQVREAAAGEWAAAERLSSFGFDQLRDPATNTYAGTWYLARLLKRYVATDDPEAYALADYNAGRKNVLRWNEGAAATNGTTFVERISFPGTREYVESVKQRRHHYRAQFRRVLKR